MLVQGREIIEQTGTKRRGSRAHARGLPFGYETWATNFGTMGKGLGAGYDVNGDGFVTAADGETKRVRGGQREYFLRRLMVQFPSAWVRDFHPIWRSPS